MVNLFKDQQALDMYESYSKTLSNLVLGVECNCAVALLCLFSTNDSMKLENKEAIQSKQVG